VGPRLRRLQGPLKAVVALRLDGLDADGQARPVASLVTGRGAIPLVWLTMEKAMLKDQRNDSGDGSYVRSRTDSPPAVKRQ